MGIRACSRARPPFTMATVPADEAPLRPSFSCPSPRTKRPCALLLLPVPPARAGRDRAGPCAPAHTIGCARAKQQRADPDAPASRPPLTSRSPSPVRLCAFAIEPVRRERGGLHRRSRARLRLRPRWLVRRNRGGLFRRLRARLRLRPRRLDRRKRGGLFRRLRVRLRRRPRRLNRREIGGLFRQLRARLRRRPWRLYQRELGGPFRRLRARVRRGRRQLDRRGSGGLSRRLRVRLRRGPCRLVRHERALHGLRGGALPPSVFDAGRRLMSNSAD